MSTLGFIVLPCECRYTYTLKLTCVHVLCMQARLVALLLATEPEAARAHALHELQVRMPCDMCRIRYIPWVT